jgi:asparagine synthase (glutamine-hydrolysing)
MCGILGYFIFGNGASLPSREKFIEALDLQAHRGPDDWGIESGTNFFLGHRRLSIIDLNHGARQPMVSDDQRMLISFNGEIYNFIELRQQLSSFGQSFKTKSDTEVLLNGICYQGMEFIEKCIGMFAFAIYDKVTGSLHLVRDRLGIKPLYYWLDNNKIIFSSEIKSILKLLNRTPELNIGAVSSYLSYRYPIEGDSFFQGIRTLKPAHFLKIQNGTISEKEYWNPKNQFLEQHNDQGEAYYLQALDAILRSSVKYRMVSDVPIGAYLSGGVDSSIVVACMAKESVAPVKTFSIGFLEDGYNEFSFAREVAEKYQTEHHEIVLSGTNYMETMERLISYKDAPLSVPNEVPLYEMSRELKKYITVVLSGEGADEIFGGYGRIFRSCFDYQRRKSISNMNDIEKSEFLNNFINKYSVNDFEDELDHFLNIYGYTSANQKKELLSSEINLEKIALSQREVFRSLFEDIKEQSYENKMMYTFERVHLLGLLHRVDMTTMATSVEARVPFVDHRLVEFAFTVPLKYKLRWNSKENLAKSMTLMSNDISEVYDTPKYILKKASEKYLPPSVIYRKKMGFPVPLNEWYGGKFKTNAMDILLDTRARNRGIYNVDNIEKWLRSDRLSKDHSFAMKIWMLINLEMFFRKYYN